MPPKPQTVPETMIITIKRCQSFSAAAAQRAAARHYGALTPRHADERASDFSATPAPLPSSPRPRARRLPSCALFLLPAPAAPAAACRAPCACCASCFSFSFILFISPAFLLPPSFLPHHSLPLLFFSQPCAKVITYTEDAGSFSKYMLKIFCLSSLLPSAFFMPSLSFKCLFLICRFGVMFSFWLFLQETNIIGCHYMPCCHADDVMIGYAMLFFSSALCVAMLPKDDVHMLLMLFYMTGMYGCCC